MKQPILVLLISLLSLTCSSQVPDYFDNDPVWRESCSFQITNYCIQNSDRQISINGDTTMNNGITYKSLFIQSDNSYQNLGDPFGCGDSFYGEGYYTAIRQSGDSIFQFWNNEETLVLHYTFDVGDTLQGAYYFESAFEPIVVTSIDSVETYNGWHRRFNLYSESGGNSEYLVEGIGHSYGFLGPIEITVNGVCNFVCYRQNGEFQFGPNNVCSIISSIPELSNIEFRLFPNPVSENLVTLDIVDFEQFGDLSATLTSIDGKQILGISLERQSESVLTMNLGDITSGIYLLTLHSNNGRTNRRLIVE